MSGVGVSEVIGLAVVVAGLVCAHVLMRNFRAVDDLGRARPGAAARMPDAIIPARNESATLPGLLSALSSRTPVVPATVVDDDSGDDTRAVAAACGARVVSAGAPPDGWTGKAWACLVGAEATDADTLLFLDADTRLDSSAVAALEQCRDSQGGLLSVQPYHRVVRPYENASLYFNCSSILASAVFSPGLSGRGAMAFGPCLLTCRDDYVTAGTHRAVRSQILDDVALARSYQAAGLTVGCLSGGAAVQMRSYPGGIGQLVAGWTKNMAAGAGAAHPVAALGTVLWICAQHIAAVGVVQSAWAWSTGSPVSGAMLAWVLAYVVVAAQLRRIARRLGSFALWATVLFPVPLLVFDAIFLRSLVQTHVRHSVSWRGRAVPTRDQ